MKILKETSKTVDQAVADLTAAVIEQKFGVLHVHNLHATLNKKGVPFEPQCQVLEVCNPAQAAKVMADDRDMNMALPCRISVYEKDGKTYIGMFSPSQMLAQFSDSEVLKAIAEEVEEVLITAMEKAV